MMRTLVLVAVIALSRVAGATPWGDRCKARLAKAVPTLKSIGAATVTVASPGPAPARGSFASFDAFGQVMLAVKGTDRAFTASIGSDHSGHRYRGQRGMESKRYEEWHSPYVDAINGDPPGLAEQPMLEEFHHRVAVGSIRAELRVDVAGVKPTTRARRSGPGPGLPAYTGREKLFADTVRPILEACWTDVLPEEADPSLAWTTSCLSDLSAAHAALVKRDPVFANGACAREPFGASCGNVHGAEPTWNALTTLAGGPTATRAWTAEGSNRRRYADGGALIWASAKLTSAQYGELASAFEKPLARCWQLLADHMYVP